jgi:hypothetical protein
VTGESKKIRRLVVSKLTKNQRISYCMSELTKKSTGAHLQYEKICRNDTNIKNIKIIC